MKRKVLNRALAGILTFALVASSAAVAPQTAEAASAKKPTKITLSAKKKTLYVGKTYTLKVKSVTPKKASKKVSFKSSNKKVATVTSKGKITAKKKGTATITVTSKVNKKIKAKCKITVKQQVKKITVSNAVKDTVVVKKGKTLKLKVKVSPSNANNKKVKFSSSKKSVATVTSKGTIKAKKTGSAKITIKSADGKAKKTIKVVVPKKKVTKVTLNKKNLSLEVGKTYKLKATVSPKKASCKVVSWTSSKKSVATVSSNGKVTAKKAGKATITVKTLDGSKKAKCTVTVKAAQKPQEPTVVDITGVTLDKTSATIKANETVTLKATVAPTNATVDTTVTWSSNNAQVKVVNGTVTAAITDPTVDKVEAVITATTKNNKTATCKVTVVVNENAKTADYTYVLDRNAEAYTVNYDGKVVSVDPESLVKDMQTVAKEEWTTASLKDSWKSVTTQKLVEKLALAADFSLDKRAEITFVGEDTMTVKVTAAGKSREVRVVRTDNVGEQEDGSFAFESSNLEITDMNTGKVVALQNIVVEATADAYKVTTTAVMNDKTADLVLDIAKDGTSYKLGEVVGASATEIASVVVSDTAITVNVDKTSYVHLIEEANVEDVLAKTVVTNCYAK